MKPILTSLALALILLGHEYMPFTTTEATAAQPSPTKSVQMELVMVEEDGCMWCARWNKEIAPIYPKTKEGKQAPLRRIDKNAAMPNDIKATRGIYFTPTFLLLVNSTEAGRIEGYPGEDFFWGLLGQLIASAESTAKSNQN